MLTSPGPEFLEAAGALANRRSNGKGGIAGVRRLDCSVRPVERMERDKGSAP
jgi:hypothetical protein